MVLCHILLIIGIKGKIMFVHLQIASIFLFPLPPIIPLTSSPLLTLFPLLFPSINTHNFYLASPTRPLFHFII